MLQPAELAELIAGYQSGTSIEALGRQFDLHEQNFRAHLVRADVQLRPQKMLTPDQITEIVAVYQGGASLRELATVRGVSESSIHNCLLGTGVKLRLFESTRRCGVDLWSLHPALSAEQKVQLIDLDTAGLSTYERGVQYAVAQDMILHALRDAETPHAVSGRPIIRWLRPWLVAFGG